MTAENYREKAMKMDDYSIIIEYDKLMNEIWDLENKLSGDRKKYSGFFTFGHSRFKSIERIAKGNINEKLEKTNFLAQTIYSVR